MDALGRMKLIDEEYLKDFEAIPVDSAIPLQKAFEKMRSYELEYPVSVKEDEKDKTYLSLNYAVGLSTDPELYIAMEILEYILLSTPASPLRKALIEAGLGKDVSEGMTTAYFSLFSHNCKEFKSGIQGKIQGYSCRHLKKTCE